MTEIEIGGFYRHYKGGIYAVNGIATHTETGEQFVIYHRVGELVRMWARPLSMFMETVDGKPRFEKLEGDRT